MKALVEELVKTRFFFLPVRDALSNRENSNLNLMLNIHYAAKRYCLFIPLLSGIVRKRNLLI